MPDADMFRIVASTRLLVVKMRCAGFAVRVISVTLANDVTKFSGVAAIEKYNARLSKSASDSP